MLDNNKIYNDPMVKIKVHKEINPLFKDIKFKSQADKEDAIVEFYESQGIKKIGDIIPTRSYDEEKNGQISLKFAVNEDRISKNIGSKKLIEQIQLSKAAAQQNIKLGVTGSDYLDGTSLITGVIEQVTPVVENEIIAKMFPEGEYSANKLFMDVWQPISGMTHANAMDAPVNVIQKRGFQTEEWLPPFYNETLQIDQNEALNLRDPGNQNLAIRGLAAAISKWTAQLTHRGGTRRLNDIYSAIFTGSYTWQGEALSYGIPSGNRFTAGALNGVWGTITGTNYVPNPSSNPILDMTVIHNLLLILYRGLPMTWIMNPNTMALFSQNPTVINRVNTQYSDAIMQKAKQNPNSMESISTFYLGSDINIGVLVDGSAYIADANDPNGHTAGTTNYILPDYQIWIKIDTDKFGGPYGEYAYCLAAQNGGLQNARPGKFFQIIDSMASSTVIGTTQPNITLMNGWRGGVRLPRYFDVITFNVGT